jgi:hypothetical protein
MQKRHITKKQDTLSSLEDSFDSLESAPCVGAPSFARRAGRPRASGYTSQFKRREYGAGDVVSREANPLR